MTAMFNHYVNGIIDFGVDMEIPAEKRVVRVLKSGLDRQGAKVGWFSFGELCATSRGRADFSVVAQQMNTVFIEGIPEFSADLGAEFRRFVSLIDMLYGKKVL